VNGTAATAGAGTLAEKTIVRVQGGGLASPVDIVVGDAGTAVQTALDTLRTSVANNAALQAAGISLNNGGALTAGTTTLSFTSKRGESFNVSTAGDVGNLLKLGTFRNSSSTGTSFDYTSIQAGSAYDATTGNAVTVQFSVAGGAAQAVTVTIANNDAIAVTVNQLNSAILGNATLKSAGMVASNSGGSIKFDSSNGTAFRINVTSDANDVLGFGATLGAAGNATLSSTAADNTNNVHYDAGGEYATSTYQFNPILNGQDAQTLNFTANDATGAAHSLAVVLQNNGTDRNARSLDEAISEINTKLQQSNDATLKKIVAVKEYNDGIRFVSTAKFDVGIGQAGTGGAVGVGQAADQGKIAVAAKTEGGSQLDIGEQALAETAVSALASAISKLGDSQAVVGRGQNQFNFAINLAQSEVSNIAAAESRIRDADLAQEAANLTKAQIVLQAGIAALAQANSAPQAVLALLRG
jgi:flagellin